MKVRLLALCVIGALLLASGTIAAACGGGSPSDAGSKSRWLELLGHVPATKNIGPTIEMNDYERAREIFDIELPALDADAKELVRYAIRLRSSREGTDNEIRPGVGPLWLQFPGDLRAELGFTIANVDQDILAGIPGSKYLILRGRFDPEAIERAVRTGPVFSDMLEEASHRGVDYYTWGEDFSVDLSRKSTVRPIGEMYRLALHGDYLYWARWTDGLEAMIDAGLGERRSLADLEEYQLLAQGLDSLDTYTALFLFPFPDVAVPLSKAPLVAAGMNPTPERVRELREQLQREPHLLPYQAFATGAGEDADAGFMAVVVVHADEEVAQQNVERLELRIAETSTHGGRPWRELITDFEISSQGRLLVAKLYTTETGLWYRFPVTRDFLLLYDDTMGD